MFGVDFPSPYAPRPYGTEKSRDLTSLSNDPVRIYGFQIVTTRPKPKSFNRLCRQRAPVVSPCLARSTRCHPKHGVEPPRSDRMSFHHRGRAARQMDAVYRTDTYFSR